ncbi:hypothetical protein AKJ09_02310 [Labilithrix luteola]|uniref:Uncharacterized protein n=1 Tax=Labilithrix luteola TaxID=1391654 RepID=A0A0K1PQI1_9BACT|nr:hypothetical protein AKJ09_02310 [Labilithrix luteola]
MEKIAALLIALAWAESTRRSSRTRWAVTAVRGLYQIGGHGDLSDPRKASRTAKGRRKDHSEAWSAPGIP